MSSLSSSSSSSSGGPKSSSVPVLSDYERKRAENIERNNARLRALGLISVHEEDSSNALAWKRRTENKENKGGNRKRKTSSNCSSSRKSLRLQGKQPTHNGIIDEINIEQNEENNEKNSTAKFTRWSELNEEERKARIEECRKVRQRIALEVSQDLDRAAKENPTATYEHCLMRVRTMTHKGLMNRVKAIERAAGKHCVVKMAIFKSCLQDEDMSDLADLASDALERLKALQPPPPPSSSSKK